MMQNMGVMFKTLNMMEEFHMTQMNEMRNQISAISTQNENGRGNQGSMNGKKSRKVPQTSMKKKQIKIGSLGVKSEAISDKLDTVDDRLDGVDGNDNENDNTNMT